jgi:transposase
MLDGDTGAVIEKTLKHEGEAVREFYASIPPPVLVGVEATGSMGWFLRLMEELAIECRVEHPTAIRKAETRRQKHDRRDAALLLQLLTEDRFPAIWMPSTEYRDLRSLLLHRHQWVRMRTWVQNALHAIVLAHGVRRGHMLWNREGQALLASLPLPPHTADRRSELQALYQHLQTHIELITRTERRRPGGVFRHHRALHRRRGRVRLLDAAARACRLVVGWPVPRAVVPARIALGHTEAWLRFARWLVR